MLIKYYFKKYKKSIINYYKLTKLKKIRNKLKLINDITSVINILNEISYLNICNSDNLLNVIYACYLIDPPNELELQKLSELQQIYNNKLNIEEFSIMTLWCCVIFYIDNLPKLKRQKTWP